MSTPAYSRRRFLHAASRAALGTVGAYGLLGTLRGIGLSAAQASDGGDDDYRALVCVYLDGGNDGFNLLVPRDAAGYAVYQASRQQRALPRNQLLAITPTGGGDFGLHPRAPELRALFQGGRMALLANVGSLLAPTTLASYRAQQALPPQLFSHADQRAQWMLGEADLVAADGGWGGRLADLMLEESPGQSLPTMNISLTGNSLFLSGAQTIPYCIAPGGVVQFPAQRSSPVRAQAQAELRRQALASGNPLGAYIAAVDESSIAVASVLQDALASAAPLNTVFPATPLGDQLAMVAWLMAVRRTAQSPRRQIFHVSLGGFDTHDDQDEQQALLLRRLSQALGAFDAAMTELGLSERVTAFTLSDFGRTLTGNGDGTNHGWGSHHLILGGAVRGRALYGTLPDLRLGSADDAGRGRMIPTTAVDQYAATLARWFGARDEDLPVLFPNLDRFASRNLGFLRSAER